MTDHQKDAIAKVHQILDEHFECWVSVVQIEVNDKQDNFTTFYHGGFANAKGLLVIGQDYLRLPSEMENKETD